MVSTKIIFRKDKMNSAGEHPLYLRLIHNRKSKYISLGQYLKPEHWDDENRRIRKSHPNSQRLNNWLAQKIAEAQGVALELESNNKYTSPRQVKNQILGNTSENFFTLAEKVMIEKHQIGSYSTYANYKLAITKVRSFSNGKALMIDEITYNWLKNFELYLCSECNLKINTIHTHLKIVRKIVNEAITRELLPLDKNPFIRFKLKSENVVKAYLTEDELQAMEELQLVPGSLAENTRNIYVFASYSGGLRLSDLLQLKWSNIVEDKLIIKTQKTGSLVSIKLANKALEILSMYKATKFDENSFVFPFLKEDYNEADKDLKFIKRKRLNPCINSTLKSIAKKAGIKKSISMHCARHGFAIRALSKGMRIEYVSKLMGHSNISITQVYAKTLNADLDNAMAVFN